MVTDSLALFRSNRSKDLHKLAEEHLEHEFVLLKPPSNANRVLQHTSLQTKDREILRRAGRKLSTHVGLGSLVGIGLGLYGAYKLRNMRLAYFNAFKVTQKTPLSLPVDISTDLTSHPRQWRNPSNSASPMAA